MHNIERRVQYTHARVGEAHGELTQVHMAAEITIHMARCTDKHACVILD